MTGLHKSFLYQVLSIELKEAIERQVLKPGERLPSIRSMSRRRNVSMNTVARVYQELELEGYLAVQDRSGYFVCPPPRQQMLQPQFFGGVAPQSLSLDQRIERLFSTLKDPELLSLGAGLVDSRWLPARALKRYLSDAVMVEDFHPEPIVGNDELRIQLARYALTQGYALNPGDLIITSGCTESLHLALRMVTQPGDLVMVESPTYFGFHLLLRALGLRSLEFSAGADGLNLHHLEIQLRRYTPKALLLIPSFNNPTGKSLDQEARADLVALCEAFDIPIIEDLMYHDLYFHQPPPPPLYTYSQRGMVLSCASANKVLSLGFRIGWIATGRYHQPLLDLKHINTLCTSGLLQNTLARLLADGVYQQHVQRLRQKLWHNAQLFLAQIQRCFPQDTHCHLPEGGMFLWVELPAGYKADQIYEAALRDKISVVPGSVFSPSQNYHHCLRLNIATPFTPAVEMALQRLGQLAHAQL
jgi:DNA-binding transcriptional MocR family regulator